MDGQTTANQTIERDEKGRFLPGHSYQWQPGQSGNPEGRQPAGATVREWFNTMKSWAEGRLETTAQDKDAPAAKRAAAQWWLRILKDGQTKGGQPVAGPELDRLFDRTEGRPNQQVQITSESRNAYLIGLTRDALAALESVGVSAKPPRELLEAQAGRELMNPVPEMARGTDPKMM